MLFEFPNLPSVNIVTGTYWAHDSADIIPAAPEPTINTCLFDSMDFFQVTTLISIFNWIIHKMNIFNLILPPNNQFKNFEEEYTEKIDNIPRLKESKYRDFKDKIKGISSFVSMRTTIKKNFIGEHIPGIDFEFEKIATANMQLGGKQNGVYLDVKTGQTLDEDEKESSSIKQPINTDPMQKN